MAVFNCPQCGLSQSVNDKHIGRTALCPTCKQQGEVVAHPDVHSTAMIDEHEWHVVRRGQQPRAPFFARRVPSLMLEWVVIDDHRMPLRFIDMCGITPAFEGPQSVIDGSPSPNSAGQIDWGYEATVMLEPTSCRLVGFDLRFVLFDVWGQYTRTLFATEMAECEPMQRLSLTCRWPFQTQTQGEEHLGSIAYVARVRTQDGQVLKADEDFVVREARRFAEEFVVTDLRANEAGRSLTR
jgi:hypothetical protein